ncbi:zinc ribbon domain-containing protein [Chamaesiphon polymorphus]|uniref:Zinc-ribbon domain-containing protein n=1 Tax=Chamaesiphon polymorphus CCALA 037 TaxID=2107692 RepID=A0A2T1G3S1_9CYAN|nr:zinc ribbon domain-containing protein [Chamaesiphon polymorphus]PSB51899.1 hypothetical protein C7B77_21060 [Chamaesiphon polymorphus CCALA 037]
MKMVYPTCSQGHTNPPGAKFCLTCGEALSANQRIATANTSPYTPANNSGCGQILDTSISVPPQIQGWNWGAFLLAGIWAPSNRVWIGLLAWIPYVGWIVAIWLGLKGNELAWKSKRWASIEQFREHQKNWAIGSAIWTIICFIIGILIGMSS